MSELIHLSFNGDLEGVWEPRHPDGSDPDGTTGGKYPEFTEKRISVSSSIEGAFIGIYPNIAHLFEVKKYPHMDFVVYGPVIKKTTRVLSPKDLTDKRLVWDAHATGEHAILDPVFMKLLYHVRVFNTNKSPTRYTHPFDDKKLPQESIGPADIKWKWIYKPRRKTSKPVYMNWI